MKKKAGKIILITVGAIVILWGTVFITDSIRCASLKEPLFVVPGPTADDGGSGTYYGIGYTVEVEKHIDAAYGLCVDSVEMKMLGKVVSASIS
jgi:hypothetical protein